MNERHELDSPILYPIELFFRGKLTKATDNRIFSVNITAAQDLHDVIAEFLHLQGDFDLEGKFGGHGDGIGKTHIIG